jgi:hypothetical protein
MRWQGKLAEGSTMALDSLHRTRFSCLFSAQIAGKEASYQSRELTTVTDRNLLEERVLSQLPPLKWSDAEPCYQNDSNATTCLMKNLPQ